MGGRKKEETRWEEERKAGNEVGRRRCRLGDRERKREGRRSINKRRVEA